MVAESPLGPIKYTVQLLVCFTLAGEHRVVGRCWFTEHQVTVLVPGGQ